MNEEFYVDLGNIRTHIQGIVNVTLEYKDDGVDRKFQYKLLNPMIITSNEVKHGEFFRTTELYGENITPKQG